MAARGTMAGCKIVRPLLSLDNCEAHTRVLGLYRAFYRIIPFIREYRKISDKIKRLLFANLHLSTFIIYYICFITNCFHSFRSPFLFLDCLKWQIFSNNKTEAYILLLNCQPICIFVPRDFLSKLNTILLTFILN